MTFYLKNLILLKDTSSGHIHVFVPFLFSLPINANEKNYNPFLAKIWLLLSQNIGPLQPLVADISSRRWRHCVGKTTHTLTASAS